MISLPSCTEERQGIQWGIALRRKAGKAVRTLQDWEQGRRNPAGAARSLLVVASKRPKVLRELLRELPEAA